MKKIITISREFGAGGGQIGKAVAERLGYYYLDKDMIIRSAMESSNLTAADFRNFVAHRVITASEAAEILGCSRQNIIDLTKRGKLHPLKTSDKNTLYLKSEILKRNWQ